MKTAKLFLITIIITSIFSFKNVYAQNNLQSNTDIKYNLKDTILHTEIYTTLTNTSTVTTSVKSYSINLGLDNPENIVISSEPTYDISYKVNTHYKTKNKSIEISNKNIRLKPNESIKFTVVFDLNNTVIKSGNQYFIHLPNYVPETNEIININFTYPSNYGDINTSNFNVTNSNQNLQNTILIPSNHITDPVFIIGNSQYYNISYLNNVDTEISQVNSLFFTSLPQLSCNQQILYNNLDPTPLSAVSDDTENVMVQYDLLESTQYSYDFNIKKTNDECIYQGEYSWNIDNQKYQEQINTLLNLTDKNDNEKAKIIYDYIYSHFTLIDFTPLNAKTNEEQINEIVQNKSIFVDNFQLQEILFIFLQSSNIKVFYNWGVFIPEYSKEIQYTNYIWLSYVDSNNIIKDIDPLYQINTGLSGFNLPSFNKILYYRSQAFDDKLYDIETNKLKLNYLTDWTEPTRSIEIKCNYLDTIISGNEYHTNCTIKNTGNDIILKIEPVDVNEKVKISFTKSLDKILLLPNQNYSISADLLTDIKSLPFKKTVISSFNVDYPKYRNTYNTENFINVKLNLWAQLTTVSIFIIILSTLAFFYYILFNKKKF